jgi:thiamine transport system substrate-binding protein
MAATTTFLLAACSSADDSPTSAAAAPSSQGPAAQASGAVTVLTHDSFALPDEVIAAFESSSGIDVTFEPVGDAGTLVNQVALTAGAPLGDAVYGIDNTFASRAIASGALAQYVSPLATESMGGALNPIDYSDVCFNISLDAFDAENPAPVTLDDLRDPAYAGAISVSNPTTSSPGLALLLATYEVYGDEWPDFWRDLRDNNLKVTSSWSDTYFVDFAAPNYGGEYPIVLSYASSPPSEIVEGEATTAALLDTCFRQVEYAAVLDGAQNPDAAKAVIDWMLSADVQSALPGSMYVYPVSPTATIPQEWRDFAPLADAPLTMDPDTIDQVRDQLLREWTAVVIDGE